MGSEQGLNSLLKRKCSFFYSVGAKECFSLFAFSGLNSKILSREGKRRIDLSLFENPRPRKNENKIHIMPPDGAEPTAKTKFAQRENMESRARKASGCSSPDGTNDNNNNNVSKAHIGSQQKTSDGPASVGNTPSPTPVQFRSGTPIEMSFNVATLVNDAHASKGRKSKSLDLLESVSDSAERSETSSDGESVASARWVQMI